MFAYEHACDWWLRESQAAQLKVNSGLRTLWPFLAVMYMTICLANNLVSIIVWERVLSHPFVWVIIEPGAVGLVFVCALRVPRNSLVADCAFLLGVFVDLILNLTFTADSLDLNSHLDANTVVRHVMHYYFVVSMFVFAGFHFIPIILFWAASVVFLFFAYIGNYHRDYQLAIVVSICFGVVIASVASVIERRITWHSEVAERHRNAERILLEYATNGTCMVQSEAGTIIHTSPHLEKILGASADGTSSLQNLVIPEDTERVQALLKGANDGNSTVVTVVLGGTPPGNGLAGQVQDVRLMAYSASRNEVMVCLQMLGESRPRVAQASDNSLSLHGLCYRMGQASSLNLHADVFIPLSPATPLISARRDEYLEPLAAGEVSPPASQAASASQATAPFEALHHQNEMLTTAVGLLSSARSPRSISSQGTQPLPWAVTDLGASQANYPAFGDGARSGHSSPVANMLSTPLMNRAD